MFSKAEKYLFLYEVVKQITS